MGSIRVGFFEDFKGADTLLIDVDQYLDGPRDDVQVMASFGEYGDEWWNRHGN